MVITERIAWGHIPRTGGDATHTLFGVVEGYHGLKFAIDSIDDHVKHDPFWVRPASIGLDLVLNIRRLPSLFLSCRNVFMLQGIYPDYMPMGEPKKKDFLDPTSDYGRKAFDRLGTPGPLATIADRYIKQFTSSGALSISRWLRMEFLRTDFIDFVKGQYEVPATLEKMLLDTPTKRSIIHGGSDYFTEEDVKVLYENNPLWDEIEKLVY